MKAGDVFTDKNLRIIRPGLGLSPKYFEHIIGKCIKHDVKMGTAVCWGMLE